MTKQFHGSIEYTEGQRRFLREKHAKAADEMVCCDCPGCDKCKGFVKGCTCDHDMSAIRKAMGR